jgi:hypothetical protein
MNGKEIALHNVQAKGILPVSVGTLPGVIRSKDMAMQKNYTEKELHALSVNELRALARQKVKDKKIGNGIWFAGAQKAQLIQTILDGRIPAPEGYMEPKVSARMTDAMQVMCEEMAKIIYLELSKQAREAGQ